MSTKQAKDGHESRREMPRPRKAAVRSGTVFTACGPWWEGGAGRAALEKNGDMVRVWRW